MKKTRLFYGIVYKIQFVVYGGNLVSNKLKYVLGLFFEERESTKSTKPFILIRHIMMILTGLILILAIFNVNFNFIKYIILLFGIGSIIDGFERFLKKGNKRQMLLDFGFAFICFVLFFMELTGVLVQ
ncbi:hypothetical protein [Peribacillus muralis]|uniref:hypothetical protein n=1 Tax=Peribacillus muralis TaxID=264697 RepID=UPI003670E65F